MSADDALTLVTYGFFLLLFALTLADFVRHRDRNRLEILLMFASLAVGIAAGIAGRLGLQAPWLAPLGAIAILAQPYLQLRLVEHFRAVPRPISWTALGGMIASWALYLLAPDPRTLPGASLGVVLLYFFAVEAYASAVFVQGALTTGGISRRQLTLAALASGFLASAIVLSTLSRFLPIADFTTPVMRVVSALTAVSYFLAFTPPRWLREAWQLAELQGFLRDMQALPVGGNVERLAEGLCQTATRSVGGTGSTVLIWDEGQGRLRLVTPLVDPERVAPLDASEAALRWVWKQGKPVLLGPGAQPRAENDVLAAMGARWLFAVPIANQRASWGLLLVARERGSLFADSDLRLLDLLAEQAAMALENAHLLTEREALVQRLEARTRDLEAASQAKSAFLANMSHELRTPLNAIIGFSDLLLDEPEDGYDPDTRRIYARTIRDSGQHLVSLINDILDLSKVEAGRMELHLEPVRIDELVARVAAAVEPLATEKGLRLTVDTGGAGQLLADEGRVRQVLYNLLSNAIKFTPHGGEVTVQAQQVEDVVRLTVADTGIGIAPEDQEHIFEEFQQVEMGPGRQYEGTGLGLALTKRFVELHGGRIWVESAPGEGSRFHVELPARPALAEAAAPARPAPVGAATASPDGPLVLVVEDDPRAANLLAVHLGRAGYRTDVAESAREALGKAHTLRPAAITLDILLPGVDGWEVLRTLKSDEATRDIPVLVVSVVDSQPLGYALGAIDYFVKPVDHQALLRSLARQTFTTKVREREVRVLVVDDESSAVELLAQILEPIGFTVLRAGGGAEAIALAGAQRPDLVLLDLMMPEVNGFDVVEALKSNAETRNIPILVITAKDLTEEEKAALNGDVAAVLQKGGFAGVDLLAWLEQLLGPQGAEAGGTL